MVNTIKRITNMNDEKIQSLEELCDYIVKYCEDIYVREQINGKWGSYSLAELPVKSALSNAMTFIKEGRIPLRVTKE